MVWANAAIPVLIAGFIVLLALRPMSDRRLDLWAQRFGVVLSEAAPRGVARSHLRRERTARSVGAAMGVLLMGLPVYATVVYPEMASRLSSPVLMVALVFGAGLGSLFLCVLANVSLVYGTEIIFVRPALGHHGLMGLLDAALRASDTHQLAGVAIAQWFAGVGLLFGAMGGFSMWFDESHNH